MTKKEIVRKIAEDIHETQLKTKEIVQLTFNAIVETLLTERRIELRNFGVFEVKLRKPRKARNPRTDDPVDVPAKFVVTFKPGKEMEEKVRELKPRAEDLERLNAKARKAAAQAAAAASATDTSSPPPSTASAPPAETAADTPTPPDGNGSGDDSGKKKRSRKAAQA